MSSRYLLDTNTASYIIKGNVPRVRERLLKVPMSQVLISAVTEGELLFGAARKCEALRWRARRPGDCGDPHGKFGHDDRGARVGRGSRSGDKRSFFSPIEGVKNRGLDKVETFSALVQVCFSAPAQKSPLPA